MQGDWTPCLCHAKGSLPGLLLSCTRALDKSYHVTWDAARKMLYWREGACTWAGARRKQGDKKPLEECEDQSTAGCWVIQRQEAARSLPSQCLLLSSRRPSVSPHCGWYHEEECGIMRRRECGGGGGGHLEPDVSEGRAHSAGGEQVEEEPWVGLHFLCGGWTAIANHGQIALTS